MTEPTRRPVTIVVPIYGDPPSLLQCVRSLIENVDFTTDNVLLVNDCGPDADSIERELLALIAGKTGFRYERNQANLGFVGTCNRAVLELDRTDNDILLLNSDTVTTPGFVEELAAVLHLSPTHGIVNPRSNNATIASIPFERRRPSPDRPIERSRDVHSALASSLPRYSISPVSMGFCFLVRREIIAAYGLFDTAFAPGYGEENDLCLRANAAGYNSLIAHRVIVFHAGARSFESQRRNALRSAHEKILARRYPWYSAAVRNYLALYRDPVDVFADVLVPHGDDHRILLVFSDAPLDEQPLTSILDAILHEDPSGIDFAVSASPRTRRRLAARFGVLRSHRPGDGEALWDAVLFDPEAMSPLRREVANRVSPRWIPVVGEVDALTSWRIRGKRAQYAATLSESLRFASFVFTSRGAAHSGVSSFRVSQGLEESAVGTISPGVSSVIVHDLLRAVSSPVDIENLRRRWVHYSADGQRRGTPRRDVAPAHIRIVRWIVGFVPGARRFALMMRGWTAPI